MMGKRTIDPVEISLRDMVDKDLISVEQAEAEEASRIRMTEHATKLQELACRIDDPVLRWNILSGGH